MTTTREEEEEERRVVRFFIIISSLYLVLLWGKKLSEKAVKQFGGTKKTIKTLFSSFAVVMVKDVVRYAHDAGGIAFAASLSSQRKNSLSLSLLYIYTCGLSSFLKNVFILFLDLKKECALTKHRPLFSFSLSLRLFISLFESCLRDNNRDD